MPFNQLQRRDSWPPTIIRIHPDESSLENAIANDPIDEDPFSFFLTSPDDIDDSDDGDFEDLSAGIESPSSSPSQLPPVRAVSPSSLEHILEEEQHNPLAIKLPLSLREFTSLFGRQYRTSHRGNEEDVCLGIDMDMRDMGAMRGRPRARAHLTPYRGGSGRGRGQTRSLPGRRRPHAWRVPSPDVWSIEEEQEDTEIDNEHGAEVAESPSINDWLGGWRISEASPSFASSSPIDKRLEDVKSAEVSPRPASTPSPKPKKRVHWALHPSFIL